MNIKELIIPKKWSIFVVSAFFIIIMLLLFYFNFDSKSYEERFLDKAREQFGDNDKKLMAPGTYQTFLKGYIKMKLTGNYRNAPDKFLLQIQFPRTKQSTSLGEIQKDRHRDIALRFKPVDVQYTVTLDMKNETKVYLNVGLNEEFVRSALRDNMPPIEPKYPIFEETHSNNVFYLITGFILSFISNIIINIIANLIAGSIEKRSKGKEKIPANSKKK